MHRDLSSWQLFRPMGLIRRVTRSLRGENTTHWYTKTIWKPTTSAEHAKTSHGDNGIQNFLAWSSTVNQLCGERAELEKAIYRLLPGLTSSSGKQMLELCNLFEVRLYCVLEASEKKAWKCKRSSSREKKCRLNFEAFTKIWMIYRTWGVTIRLCEQIL